MRKSTTLCAVLAIAAMLFSAQLHAQNTITGTVFRDFNHNGTRQNTVGTWPVEPGAFGIVVRAYNAAGTLLATKTTGADGTYLFTNAEVATGTAVRLEFSSPEGQFDASVGGANSTNVQFVTASSATPPVANFAVAHADWFSTNGNPFTATNAYSNGNSEGNGNASTNNNLYVFPWNMGSGTPDVGTGRLPNKGLGTVFGMGWQRTTRTLFMSAFLKRHSTFGPNGMGAIYKSAITAGTPAAASLLVDVTAIGINVGTNPRAHTLPEDGNLPNNDTPSTAPTIPNANGVFANIGKVGIGGIDVSDDDRDLYLVNMSDKRLYRINIGLPLKTSFTAADVTGNWLITDPNITGTSWRPMACKTANGKVYVGGVTVIEKTTAFNLTTDTVGMRGIVYEFDPATQAFTEVLRFPLSRRKGFSNGDPRFPFRNNWWCGWQNNGGGASIADPFWAGYAGSNTIGAATAYNGGVYYPQPMLADIEFDVDGSMIIGLRDRGGDQAGYANRMETNSTFTWRSLSSGEVLRAGRNTGANTFTMESGGSATSNGVTTTSTGIATTNTTNAAIATSVWTATSSGTPWGGNFGPGWVRDGSITAPTGGPALGTGGGYYYFNNNFDNSAGLNTTTLNYTATFINAHYNKTNGGLALLAGSNEVANTAMDPALTAFTQGVIKNYNQTTGTAGSVGNMSQRIQLVATTTTPTQQPLNMGKGNGMGNIEVLTDAQPIEIGNRIWSDVNGNGIQDAGEITAGVAAGTTVTLRSPGVNGIYGDGDDQSWTTTTDANGNYYFNTLSAADNRKPAAWIGITGNTVLPGFSYRIEVTIPANNTVTLTDIGGNDAIDNDAIVNGTTATVTFTTNNTNHNYDIGFWKPNSLGNKVWRDDNNDGNQNTNEPGVAGVVVTLFRSTNTTVGDADDVIVGTTTTDAYGNYLFTNLPDGNYNVKFTLPNNYSFTIQNTPGDNGDDTDSDGNPTTGRSDNFVLTAGVSGETDLTLDAGIIFNPAPAALNSIGDKVWFDTDSDGVQDAGEPGVAGVTVVLYDATGTNVVAVTTTDANGNYIFTGLPPATNYIVGFSPLPGTVITQVPPAVANTTTVGNATTNCDADATIGTANYGRTGTINTGAAGNAITGIDCGLKDDLNASLGDRVWNDLDRDGSQDAGEPGVPGVTMRLYTNGPDGIPGNGDDVLTQTTTTDALGYYLFSNLNAGNYNVRATPPVGYITTLKDATGIPDEKDSDFTAAQTNPTVVVSNSYGLLAGQNYMGVDLGIHSTTPLANLGSLGDRVWMDTNGNGLDDGGEQGVAGVTVSLLDGSGNPVNNPATGTPYVVVTDGNGNYKFVDLPAGSYQVRFSNLPAGTGFTRSDASGSGAPGSGTDGANDSDVNPATGRTATITLAAGQNITTVDAGLSTATANGKGSLGNRVWVDANNDGIQNNNEQGVPGVTVELLFDSNGDGVISGAELTTPFSTTTTDGQGTYMFTNLNAGTYQVRFVSSSFPAGYALQTGRQDQGTNDLADSDPNPATGLTGLYILAQGEDNLSVDAGIYNTTANNSIGDRVWLDANSDGKQDGGELSMPGVTVNLYDATGRLIASTVTDANGNYFFGNLPNGNYSVQVVPPVGYSLTVQNGSASGTTAANNSDFNASTGRTASISLTGGTNITDLDAGLISARAAIGNRVWYDTDGDGVQDAGEPGVAGVTVTLFRPGFGPDGIAGNGDDAFAIGTAVTGDDGNYLFTNLAPGGGYEIAFTTIPGGLEFTQQNTPGDNGNDTNSDANPATGRTGAYTLTAGEIDPTVDAGLRPRQLGSVGDVVWFDVDNDGINDPGEAGVPGVIVTLRDGLGNVIGTTVTDGNGNYLFTNVPAGTGYTITFSNLPTGALFTTQNASGSTSSNNSDADATTGVTGAFTVVGGQKTANIDAGVRNYSPLPVSIISFNATPKSGAVEAKWVVGVEINVRNYTLEHSVDGVTFSALGVTDASGAANYTAMHNNPVTGINYYRLRITDDNGKVTYSEIRRVSFGKGGIITVYPNPAASVVNITVTDRMLNKPLTLQLYNAAGSLLLNKAIARANQTEKLDVSALPSGKYFIRMTLEGEVITQQFNVGR